MSIEASSTATITKAVTAPAGSAGKGKATSGDAAQALAAGGFLALLTSFEPAVAVDVEGAGAATQTEAADARPAAEAVAQLAALPVDPSLLALTPDTPTDLAMMLAQAGAGGVDKPATLGVQRATGAKEGGRLAATAIAADKPEVAATATALLTEAPAELRHKVDALLEQAAQGLQARTLRTRDAELRSGAGASLAETRALHQSLVADGAAREPALSGALLASGVGDGFLRQGDRAAAKSSFSLAGSGSGIEGIWGQQAFQPGSRVDTPAPVADASMPSPESMVADQVSYWVAQGVQNAELKLDGFGGEAVEVSISLKGSEAHIDFRTDQPEIRQLLEGAVTQLKDILKSEGLVLSGVSVGGSGQDGAGQQERRHRPGARQATITTTPVGPTQAPQRSNPSVGRALDLFV